MMKILLKVSYPIQVFGLFTALFLTILALTVSAVHAEGAKKASPFYIRNSIDLPLILASLSMTVTPVLFISESPQSIQPPYDRSKVFFFDRSATNFHSTASKNLSYILTVTVPVAVTAASLPWGEKEWAESYQDLVLIGEALAFTSLTNQLVRNAFRRPRPYLYKNNVSQTVTEREDLSSFFSGHTAATFALGISFWHIHEIRNPDSPANPYILAGAIASGTLMGISRVLAGFHFWTDVIAGGIVGSAIGYLVPEFHRIDDGQPGSVILSSLSPQSLAVGVRF